MHYKRSEHGGMEDRGMIPFNRRALWRKIEESGSANLFLNSGSGSKATYRYFKVSIYFSVSILLRIDADHDAVWEYRYIS